MATRRVFAWYDGNTMVVQLGTPSAPLKDMITGAVQTGATVTVRVLTAAGVPVAGATWPLTMPHAGAGIYRVSAPLLALTLGVRYIARVEATVSGNELEIDADVIFVKRRSA